MSELLVHLCGLNVAAEFFLVLHTWFKCYNAVTVGFVLFSSELMLMSGATVLNAAMASSQAQAEGYLK